MAKPLLKAFVYTSPPSLSSSDDDMSIKTSDNLAVPLLLNNATSRLASSDDTTESTQQETEKRSNLLKRYGILIGIIVGISLVLSQLGLQVLLLIVLRHVVVDYSDVVQRHTKMGWTIIALPWITITALCVFFVMHLFLRVASTTYSMGRNSSSSRTATTAPARPQQQQLPEMLLESLQIRFLIGTLIGAFLSSIILDTCIGTSSDDLLFNVGALLASLMPYVIVKVIESRCIVRRHKAATHKKFDQESMLVV